MRYSATLPDTDLWAAQRSGAVRPVPPRFPHLGVATVLQAHLRTEPTAEARRSRAGGDVLAVGQRGRELDQFDLVAVARDDAERAELAAVRRRLGLFALTVLLLALGTGTTMSHRLLVPVRDLNAGVAALHARRFHHRVPVHDRDELGHLALAFNAMLEGTGDLEVARIVQEVLLPAGALTAGAWQVFGRCVPASSIGGDYHDHRPLPDGRVAIVVGDVAGHGVAAALVMAVARAVVAHPDTPSEPAALLAVLNEVLCRALRQRAMMTCVAGLLDPAGQRLLLCNGGHPDPLLVRGGVAQPLVSRHVPLGVRPNRRYQTREFALQAGDRLLFYTDGFVEAPLADGHALGFERFVAAVPALLAADPVAAEAAVRRWHAATVAGGPARDDMTLVVATCSGCDGRSAAR